MWVIISAGVGGLIGALIKFVFEQIWTTKYKHEFDAQKTLSKYKYPLLRVADSLDRRLQNSIQFASKQWYSDPVDDYYRISTLYLLGSYFGWCKILEDEAFIEFETSNKRAKDFSIIYHRVYKGITGFQYFHDFHEISEEEIEYASVPRMALTAIAELMIKNNNENGSFPKIIDFIEFSKHLNSSPEFQKWFGYFDRLFKDLKQNKNDPRWNRLLVFATNLRIFVCVLDSHRRMTTPRKIYYLKQMHPSVRKDIYKEIEEQGFSELVITND